MIKKRTISLAVASALLVSGVEASTAGATSAGSGSTECGTSTGGGCAPDSARVDLEQPSFSNPTEVTNPLFPIGRLESVVLLGHVEGKPFRTETTLLPGTTTVVLQGQPIEVLVSQYVAYLDGRIEEVALDRYAQDDNGAVWYFGEDVFDYRDGAIAITEGTWLAGREGPPAMIMPAHPKVGDAYRTENAPPIVFEEVTVDQLDRTVDGPTGRVNGALVAKELHSDGTTENKTFAPGYGEFRTAGGGDLEALALAIPADALPGPPPAELQALLTAAGAILESARLRDWESASAALARSTATWRTMRADQPPMIVARLDEALARLTRALKSHASARAAQAAIDVQQSALDVTLRYRPAAEVDARRFELWTQQLRVLAAAKDLAGVTGTIAALEWIRDRFANTLDPVSREEVDGRLRALRAATDARNLPAAADHAARLGARVRDLRTVASDS